MFPIQNFSKLMTVIISIVAGDYVICDSGIIYTPIPQKYLKSQDRTIVSGPGMNPHQNLFHPGHSKKKVRRELLPYALIVDNLETSLANTMDKDHANASGTIFKMFIKPRASTIFGQPVYFLDGLEPSIAVSGLHEECFNSTFGIWIG